MNTNDLTKDILIFCPHCGDPILIEQLNCRIFRHGTFITTGEQINPHEPKELCDLYIKNKEIYGCGKPFEIDNELKAVICEYK